jgi:hypothetical protein
MIMKGKCYYCKKEFTKSGIQKHLKSCEDARRFTVGDDTSTAVVENFILSISPIYDSSDYWLYILINKDSTLRELDQFLRDVWLECCGHLSSFVIEGERYDSHTDEAFGYGLSLNKMSAKLKNVVELNDRFRYMYDFGSTTYLEIRVASELLSGRRKKKIEIMARNNAPSLRRSNSPRTGVCGYKGHVEDEKAYLPEPAKPSSKVIPFKNQAQVEEKPAMEKPFSIDSLLATLTKNELLDIARNLNIEKVSSLKKEELKEKISELYEDRAGYALQNMDTKRYQFLLAIAEHSGYVEAKEEDNWNFSYLLEKGLLFKQIINKASMFAMPEEFRQIVLVGNNNAFRKHLSENEELIHLFWAMCCQYGVITLDNFKGLVKDYIDYDISDRDLRHLMQDGAYYYDEFNFDGYLGSDILVDDPVHIFLEQDKRKDLNYYPFKKSELLDVISQDFIEDNKPMKRLRSFLVGNYNIGKDEADDMIFVLDALLKNDKPTMEVVSGFIENFNFEDIQEANAVTAEIIRFSNNTRLWALKGYSPQELNPELQPVSKETQAGRNEPCPCGSGKKYKKCCGKL